LDSGLPSEIQLLVAMIGESRARTVLKRSSLLSYRLRRQRFSANPARRIKEVDQALKEQLELKDRARLKR
jgi:hypothetical protein